MLKQDIGGNKFKEARKVETFQHNDQLTQGMDLSPQGTEKFVLWYDRCLTCDKKCVEKLWDSGTVKSELFMLRLKVKK